MAKKSNKTEHVLKLITKNDEDTRDDLFGIEHETGNLAAAVELNIVPSKKTQESSDDVVACIKSSDEKELKYEAKLKIEIQPEIEFKSKNQEEEPQDHEGSALIEQHEHLVNIAEIIAKEKIKVVMKKMNVCNCKTCVNDVLALALNSLPTKYVTTDAGKQYLQLDFYKNQYETDVLAALTKACVRVKASPRH